jgi:hypothetical protein
MSVAMGQWRHFALRKTARRSATNLATRAQWIAAGIAKLADLPKK